MKSNVKVHEVHEAPAIGKPQMQQGIRSKEEAENWAKRNGYAEVYLFKKHERVYADRLSRQPLAISGEQGQVLLEVAFWVALVLFVLLVLLKDQPW